MALRADTKAHLDVSICTPTFPSHLRPPSHLRIHNLHLASCRVHLSHPGPSQSFHASHPSSRQFSGSIRAHPHLFAHLILRADICRVHLDLDLPSPSKLGISSAKIHLEDTDRKVGVHIFFKRCQPSIWPSMCHPQIVKSRHAAISDSSVQSIGTCNSGFTMRVNSVRVKGYQRFSAQGRLKGGPVYFTSTEKEHSRT